MRTVSCFRCTMTAVAVAFVAVLIVSSICGATCPNTVKRKCQCPLLQSYVSCFNKKTESVCTGKGNYPQLNNYWGCLESSESDTQCLSSDDADAEVVCYTEIDCEWYPASNQCGSNNENKIDHPMILMEDFGC